MGSEVQNREQTAHVARRGRLSDLAVQRLGDLPLELRDARCSYPAIEEHQRQFWRLTDGPDRHYVCGRCHPCPWPREQWAEVGIEAYTEAAG